MRTGRRPSERLGRSFLHQDTASRACTPCERPHSMSVLSCAIVLGSAGMMRALNGCAGVAGPEISEGGDDERARPDGARARIARAMARTGHPIQLSRCSSSGILLDNGTETFGGCLSAGGCGSSYQRERGQSSTSRRSCRPSRPRRAARGQSEWTWWPTLGRRTFMRRTCPSHGVQTMK